MNIATSGRANVKNGQSTSVAQRLDNRPDVAVARYMPVTRQGDGPLGLRVGAAVQAREGGAFVREFDE